MRPRTDGDVREETEKKRREAAQKAKILQDTRNLEFKSNDLQADKHKLVAQYTRLEAEIRVKEKEMGRLKAEIESDRNKLAMLGMEIEREDADLKKITRDINTLRYQH